MDKKAIATNVLTALTHLIASPSKNNTYLIYSHQHTYSHKSRMSGNYRRNVGSSGYRDRSRSKSPDRSRAREGGDRYSSSRHGRDYRDGRDGRDRDGRDSRASDNRDSRNGGRDSYRDARFSSRDNHTNGSGKDRDRSPPLKTDADRGTPMDVDSPSATPARKVPISLEELIKQKEQEKQALERVWELNVHVDKHLLLVVNAGRRLGL